METNRTRRFETAGLRVSVPITGPQDTKSTSRSTALMAGHLTHPVKNPKKVVFRQDLQGAHEGIDITSADGELTAVRFRIAARPETLDGVLGDMQQENQRPSNDESTKSEQPGVGADAQIHEMAFHIPIDRVMLE